MKCMQCKCNITWNLIVEPTHFTRNSELITSEIMITLNHIYTYRKTNMLWFRNSKSENAIIHRNKDITNTFATIIIYELTIESQHINLTLFAESIFSGYPPRTLDRPHYFRNLRIFNLKVPGPIYFYSANNNHQMIMLFLITKWILIYQVISLFDNIIPSFIPSQCENFNESHKNSDTRYILYSYTGWSRE